MQNSEYVTASEIGEYIYCKRGWYLRKQGLLAVTEEMKEGRKSHSRLASLLWWHKIILILGLILVCIGAIGIIVYLAYLSI